MNAYISVPIHVTIWLNKPTFRFFYFRILNHSNSYLTYGTAFACCCFYV